MRRVTRASPEGPRDYLGSIIITFSSLIPIVGEINLMVTKPLVGVDRTKSQNKTIEALYCSWCEVGG